MSQEIRNTGKSFQFSGKIVETAESLFRSSSCVGINIIFYFGEILWKAAGATEQWALRINVLTGLVNILATIPAIMLIDRIGRKPLLLVGSIGMTLTLGAMRAVFGTADAGADGKPVLGHMAAVAGLTAANLYIVAFAVSGDVGVVRRDVSQRNSGELLLLFLAPPIGERISPSPSPFYRC